MPCDACFVARVEQARTEASNTDLYPLSVPPHQEEAPVLADWAVPVWAVSLCQVDNWPLLRSGQEAAVVVQASELAVQFLSLQGLVGVEAGDPARIAAELSVP